MYKYKKLQTLINYIVTKHGNTPQGASKITVSLLVQEVTQRAGTGGQRPERPSPYKNPAVVIPKAMYKLHSRKRGSGQWRCLRITPATSPADASSPTLPSRCGLVALAAPSAATTAAAPALPAHWVRRGAQGQSRGGAGGPTRSSVAEISINFLRLVALSTLRKDIYIKKYLYQDSVQSDR